MTSANSIPGMTIQWSDLEQEPYDPEEFVERLAWRSTAGIPKQSGPVASLNPFDEKSTNPFDEDNIKAKTGNAASSKSGDGDEEFDAQLLNDTFLQAIKDLTAMQEKQRKKCQALEQVCTEHIDLQLQFNIFPLRPFYLSFSKYYCLFIHFSNAETKS